MKKLVGSVAMGFVFQLIMLVEVLLTITVVADAALVSPQAKPGGCMHRCGDVEIPYPFGTSPSCYLNEDFLITCRNSSKPFLRKSHIPVTNISLDGQLHVISTVSQDCYKEGTQLNQKRDQDKEFSLLEFTISSTHNRFTVIGCDSRASIQGYTNHGHRYMSGCGSLCGSLDYVSNGSCNGIGCCQIKIPNGLRQINITPYSFYKHIDVRKFNPCTYAFVVEQSKFNFSSRYLFNLTEKFPMVLDWTITRNGRCEEARNTSGYACKENAECYVPGEYSSGYLCKCKKGYQGNPYLSNGCQDIDECKHLNLNNCTHICVNEVGSYTCKCRQGYHGDGRKGGEGCICSLFSRIKVILGVGISFVVVLGSISCLYWMWKRRKLIKLREKFFQQNGGFLLQEQLAKRSGSSDNAKIFTAKELKKATNNYAQDRIIGRGGHGTVYKGFLTDTNPVAIKKCKIVNKREIEQFINEIVVLSQINHRNVVRLLGCCLETEVPLLVYEFVSNGTLFQHIHNRDHVPSISWETRLRIASETAEVLSYLHSAASTPIIHRDVKSSNILLDDNCSAKVSDFGASKLVPMDATQFFTMVQGTLGYLDPEYMQTSQLTEKSDVYSFGVVLVELLTGKKPISFDSPEEQTNLVVYFLSLLKEGCLFEIIENSIVNEGNQEQLKVVAELSSRCLRVKGDERPTMREVAIELGKLIMMHKHLQANAEL